MPTDAEIRGAFDHVTAAPVDTDALLTSATKGARLRRRTGVAGAVGVAAVVAVVVASFNGTSDRITTIPSGRPTIPICEGGRESVVRRDYARVVELVTFSLYLPDPVPSGACLSNVESDVLWSNPPVTTHVNLWFNWDGAQIYLRQAAPGSPDPEGFSETVLIGGGSWGRREWRNFAGDSSRGGTVSLTRRLDDGVVLTVTTVTTAEELARRFAELLVRSEEDPPTNDARAVCDAIAARYNSDDPRFGATTGDVRATTAGELARWLAEQGGLTNQWSEKPPNQPATVCLLNGDFSRLPLPGPRGAARDYAHLLIVRDRDGDTVRSAAQAGKLTLDGLRERSSNSATPSPRCLPERLELSESVVRAGGTVRVSSKPAACIPYAGPTTYRAMLLFVGRADPVVLGDVAVARDGSFTVELEIPSSASPGEAAIKMEGSAFEGAPCDDAGGALASCATYLVPFEILSSE